MNSVRMRMTQSRTSTKINRALSEATAHDQSEASRVDQTLRIKNIIPFLPQKKSLITFALKTSRSYNNAATAVA